MFYTTKKDLLSSWIIESSGLLVGSHAGLRIRDSVPLSADCIILYCSMIYTQLYDLLLYDFS